MASESESPNHSTDRSTESGRDLRQRAEEEAAALGAQGLETFSVDEARRLLHELRVHQIELEMQNEELRCAQEALEASRARYFDLYDLAPVGYVTLNAQGLILEANLTATALLGVARGALTRQPITRFIAPEDQDVYYLHRKRLFETGEPQECELRLLRRALGSAPFWARVEATAAQDVESGARVCRAVVSDITTRKQAEEALRESEARFRDLLQSVPAVAVQGYGPDGSVRYWNHASERLYGYTEQEAIGRNLLDLIVPPEMRREVEAAIRQMAETGQPVPTSELSLKRKDESRVPALSSHAIVQRSGRQPELFRIDIDLTERKQLEEQLLDARRMESVGRLAGGVAHEFNNTLTSVMGCAQFAREALAPGHPALRDIDAIIQGAERLTALTRQLLAFSRRQMIVPQVISLNVLITDLDAILRRLVGENIELDTRLEPELGLIRADRSQIEQVLINLVANGRDAMTVDRRLTVMTANVLLEDDYARQHADVTAGEYVMLQIQDTGAGMSPETKAHLFEPFFTTKGVGEGAGLGLASVYGIVRQHRGTIDVDSAPGRGTTFRVYLPREHVPEDEPALDQDWDLPRGHETVLIVEDEPAVRSLVARLLRNLGYTVFEAANGIAGLHEAQERHGTIHLVLTDVVMPGMSGKTLVDRLAQLQPNLKIIYMSGYTDDTVVRQGVLSDNVDFLQKPLDESTLAHRVRQVLDR